jgi:hypothetical protein
MGAPDHIFVAGIPSTGKTHFGRWLQAEHGYLHIDAEVEGELDRLGLREVWNIAVASQDCTRLASVLHTRGAPAVFNWGFPLVCLPIAAALKHAGFSSWWFEGDIAAARREHCRLGKDTGAFHTQLVAIQAHAAKITELFAPNILAVLDGNAGRMSPDVVLQRMCSAA